MYTSSIRSSFALKIVLGLLLVVAADWLLFLRPIGIALGLFAVLLLATAAVLRRGWASDPRSFAAAAAAFLFLLLFLPLAPRAAADEEEDAADPPSLLPFPPLPLLAAVAWRYNGGWITGDW